MVQDFLHQQYNGGNIRVLGLGFNGFIGLGVEVYTGIMAKKMETTIL